MWIAPVADCGDIIAPAVPPLSRSTYKEDEARKRAKKEERERLRQEASERRRQQDEEDEDEDGSWEKVKKGAPTAKEKLKMFAKDDEVTLSLVNKKFKEINAARGKKGNDRREMIELLHELLSIAEQHNMTSGMIIKIKFGLVSAIFDYNLAIRFAMKPDLWEKVGTSRVFQVRYHRSIIVVFAG